MISNEVRIVKEQHKIARTQAEKELLLATLRNPIFELLVGLAIVEVIPWNDSQYEAGSTRVWARSAVKTAVLVQQIAPLAPAILNATTDVIGNIANAVPAVGGLLTGVIK